MDTKESRRHSHRLNWLVAASLIQLLVVAVIGLGDLLGPERHWSTGIALYLPRWPLAVTGMGLVGVCCRKSLARWAALHAVAMLYVIGPLMGLCIPTSHHRKPGGQRLRIITQNMAGHRNVDSVLPALARLSPDLLLLQECGSDTGTFKKWLPGWPKIHRVQRGGLTLVSRFPLVPLAQEDRWLACRLLRDDVELTVVDVHLDTPRPGFEVLQREGISGISAVSRWTGTRIQRAKAAAESIARLPTPLVAGGDFNAPPSSKVCRFFREQGFVDAFALAGFGYGFSYGSGTPFRHDYLRLDHVFASEGIRAEACRTGAASGSDHRPVIADLLVAP